MDELIPNENNTIQIECAKNMRLFIDSYYPELSNIVTFKAFDNRLYIVSIYTRIIYIIQNIIDSITGISQFSTKFCIHAIQIYPFNFKENIKNTDNVCNIINNFNKLIIKSAKDKLSKFNTETNELIILAAKKNFPEDIVGVIGNFLDNKFSTRYYNYLDYIINGKLSFYKAIDILKQDFDK